jgi:hypothetical protein
MIATRFYRLRGRRRFVGLPRGPPWPWRDLRWPSREPVPLHSVIETTTSTTLMAFVAADERDIGSHRLASAPEPFLDRGPVPAPPRWPERLSLVFKDRPSTDIAAAHPLPEGQSSRGRPSFGSELPPSEHVPSLLFLPASTVYAASTACEFVAPRSRSWGSPCFQPRGHPPASRSPCLDTFLDGATPFGAFPSIVAVPRHRGRYPLAVPSRFDFQVPCVAAQGRSSLRDRRPQGFAPQPSPLR